MIQYNATLAITSALRGNSRANLYQEISFESLQQRRWCRKLCLFFKIIKHQSPRYLFELIPTARQAYLTRNKKSIPLFNVKHDYFKNSFFPPTIIEWNILDSNIRNSESLAIFKKRILKLQLWYCWSNYSLPSSLSQFFKWTSNTFQQTSKYWWKYFKYFM